MVYIQQKEELHTKLYYEEIKWEFHSEYLGIEDRVSAILKWYFNYSV
jgi:hypothetical protein